MRCTEKTLSCQVGLVAPTNTGGKMKEGMESSQEKLGSDYAEKAPKTIIYDFACSLHTYCLNRTRYSLNTPDFYRFHWNNHRSCSRGYNMDYRLFMPNGVENISHKTN